MLETKKIAKCPVCGKEHEIQMVSLEGKVLYKEFPVRYQRLVWECEESGEFFEDDELIHINLKTIQEKYEQETNPNYNEEKENLWAVMLPVDGIKKEMVSITEEEFKSHIEDYDFFEKFGNPVYVKSSDGTTVAVCSYSVYRKFLESNGEDYKIKEIESEVEKRNNEKKKENETV